MADLRTELQELVEHDPVPAPPPDLWVRGVRLRRRILAQRSLATLAAAVVAVLVLLSVDTSLVSPPPPAPVDVPASRLHAPNRIYVPSRWMADTHRPPGPLAVLSAAQRASWWFGTREGWFGISAVDGSYHWLDLPHILASWPPVLSPDGTKIGYALSGDPSAKAFSHMVGFAVYDTRTGHLSTWRIPTRHGLEAEGLWGAGWTPDSRWFVVDVGQSMTRNSYRDYGLVAFPSQGGRFRILQYRSDFGGQFGTAAPHSLTWMDGTSGRLAVLDNVDQGTRMTIRLDRTGDVGPWFSPDGTRFVFIAQGPVGPHATTNRLYVAGTVSAGARADSHLLTKRLQPYRILGWLDARTFLVDAYIEGGNGIYLLTVDARSGEFQHAIKVVHRRTWLSAPEVASGPLRNPFVAGVRPPVGLDPRLPAGGAAVVALVAAGVALGLRRRHGA